MTFADGFAAMMLQCKAKLRPSTAAIADGILIFGGTIKLKWNIVTSVLMQIAGNGKVIAFAEGGILDNLPIERLLSIACCTCSDH